MTLDLSGPWAGVLDTGYKRTHVAFELTRGENGGYGGAAVVLGSPGAAMPVEVSLRDDRRLRISIPAAGGTFAGEITPDAERMVGHFRRPGGAIPMVLTHGAPPAIGVRRARPQTPADSTVPQERVVFRGAAGNQLAGILTKPRDHPCPPCVVMATWKGPCDRDQSHAGHKPFAVIAERLAAQGVASFRYDKRGVGDSEGDFASATTHDFAADLGLALQALRQRRDLDPDGIGLLGHSEGAVVAALAATKDSSVAFCILLTPPGAPGADAHIAQIEAVSAAVGYPPEQTAQAMEMDRAVVAAILAATSDEDARRSALEAITSHPLAAWSNPRELEKKAAEATTSWNLCFLRLDPAPVYAGLRCPVLAVFGDLDRQTPNDRHLPAVRAALPRSARVRVLSGLNHLLQPAGTGAPSEYAEIEQTLAEEALELITSWTAQTGRRAQGAAA